MSLPFTPHLAYIGPGAGFISVLLWPFRIAWAAVTGRRGYKNAKIKKLAERYMAEGKLPNLS